MYPYNQHVVIKIIRIILRSIRRKSSRMHPTVCARALFPPPPQEPWNEARSTTVTGHVHKCIKTYINSIQQKFLSEPQEPGNEASRTHTCVYFLCHLSVAEFCHSHSTRRTCTCMQILHVLHVRNHALQS